MKAVAVVPGIREVRLIEQEAPRVTTPTHVKLRMLDVGVCGTDWGSAREDRVDCRLERLAVSLPAGCPFQAWSVGEALRLDRTVLADR